MSTSPRTIPRERGGYCAYLEEVQADFGLDEVQVYVGRRYSKGTCEYRTILDHENEHVSINNAIVKEYGPRLGRSIEQQLSFMPPLFAPSGDNGARHVVPELQQRIEPVAQAFQREQRRQNAAIDAEKNYGALQRLCRDWVLYRNF